MEQKQKHIIGRREIISLPALHLQNLEAKIDTGAYTSSIHCDSIEVNGSKVTCIFLDEAHPDYTGIAHELPILKKVIVRSSNGMEEERIMVASEIQLLGQTYPIQLTLTNRSNMNYPLLLGRKFLKGKFIVDVTLIHQSIQ